MLDSFEVAKHLRNVYAIIQKDVRDSQAQYYKCPNEENTREFQYQCARLDGAHTMLEHFEIMALGYSYGMTTKKI